MENQDKILDSGDLETMDDVEEQIISLNKFIFLSIISFGTYEIWWIYKAWKFFQQKEGLDIMPAARAIFSIIFLNTLFNKKKVIRTIIQLFLYLLVLLLATYWQNFLTHFG